MSKMIPRELVDTLRAQVDVSLDSYGIPCVIYIPTNVSVVSAEKKDVFATVLDLEYVSYDSVVFVEWGASVYRLKKLGLYVENMLPILAWFPNFAIVREGSNSGEKVAVNLIRRSYFVVNPEFIPNNYQGTECLELVNPAIKAMHDAVIFQGWSVVPRRIKK